MSSSNVAPPLRRVCIIALVAATVAAPLGAAASRADERDQDVTIERRPVSVAVADFDTDGRNDLAASQFAGDALRLALEDTDGRFVTTEPTEVPYLPSGIASGDFDADGKPDVVVQRQWLPFMKCGNGGVTAFFGDGSGGWSGTYSLDFFTGIVGPCKAGGVVVADADADGYDDYVAFEGHPALEYGRSRGAQRDFDTPLFLPASGLDGYLDLPQSGVAGDFDINGCVDVALVGYTGQRLGEQHPAVSVVMGENANNRCLFGARTVFTEAPGLAGRSAVAVATADLDMDGFLDLALTVGQCTAQVYSDTCPDAAVTVLTGAGDGTFLPGKPFHSFTNADSWVPSGIASGDVTGDGLPDVVVADVDTDGNLLVFAGNGDTTFTPPLSVPIGPRDSGYRGKVGGHPHVVIADLDADGLPYDVAVANPGPAGHGENSVSVRYGPFT